MADKEMKRSPIGRVVWRDLESKDQNGYYTVKLAFDPEDPEFESLREMVNESIADGWRKAPANLKHPVKDGNMSVNKDGEPWPATKDKLTVQFKTKFDDIQGKLYGKDGQSRINPEKVYAGCHARVLYSTFAITAKPQNSNTNSIRMNLEALQFCDDGDPLGGPVKGFDPTNPFDMDVNESEGHPFDD